MSSMSAPCAVQRWILYIPFVPTSTFPVYRPEDVAHDKAVISQITSNTSADCDRMLLPEFFVLRDYAIKEYQRLYMRPRETQSL